MKQSNQSSNLTLEQQIELAYKQKDSILPLESVTRGKKPSWRVMDSSGKKPESLIHCFIQRTIMDLSDGVPDYLTVADGINYATIYDQFSIPSDHTKIAVIISYQAHDYGNFAIVRNYHPEKVKKVK